ncbi:MAG: helix-turn-helix transcriptional regulator [Nitrospinae bacterium]|nr:helix-turn-helix transcriptional regulator [Nitrospinota bacterium]
MRLSLKQLTEKANVSYQTLQAWETHPPKKPKRGVIEKISKAYGIPEEQLFQVMEESAAPPGGYTARESNNLSSYQALESIGILGIGDVAQNILLNGTEEHKKAFRQSKERFLLDALRISKEVDALKGTKKKP